MEYVSERGLRWLPESSWQPVMQRSIDAFYEGKIAEGAEACRTLLNAVGLPGNIRDLTYKNQTYYAQPLQELIPGAAWQPLLASSPAGWVVCDPSPAAVADRVVLLLRAIPGSADTLSDEVSASLGDFDGIETMLIRDETHEGHRLTEVRPYFDQGVLRAAFVTPESGERGQTRAGVVTLSDGIVSEMQLFGPRQGNFQQGWSPLLVEERARFIGWWEPTEVFELIEETGEFERRALRMAPHIAERFQGGSQGIPVPGGYLFLVNESVFVDPDNEVVLTRFVRLDAGFQITDVSPQFFVKDRGKDLACGLARRGEQLIAGFTSAGNNPLLATTGVDAVLATLIPMEAPGPRSAAAHMKR